jgi:hypothetical protein
MAKNDERIARLKDSFDIFDEDGSGELSVDEVMTILTRMSGGAPLTEDDAKEFIAEVALSDTGPGLSDTGPGLSHVAYRLKLAKSSRRGLWQRPRRAFACLSPSYVPTLHMAIICRQLTQRGLCVCVLPCAPALSRARSLTATGTGS